MVKNIFPVLAVVVLIVAIIGVGLFASQMSGIGGFSVFSISPIVYTSEDSELAGPAFTITARGGGNDEIRGEVTANKFVADTGKAVTKPFKIFLSAVEETVSLSIVNKREAIYSYVIHEKDYKNWLTPKAPECYVPAGLGSCAEDVGQTAPGFAEATLYKDLLVQCTRFCIYKQEAALRGVLRTNKVGFSADLGIGNSYTPGEGYSKKISDEQKWVKFYEDEENEEGLFALVTWQGNLVTGNQLPQNFEYATLYHRGAENWRIVEATDMFNVLGEDDDVQDFFDNEFFNRQSIFWASESEKRMAYGAVVNNYKAELLPLLSQNIPIEGTEGEPLQTWFENENRVDGAKAKVKLNRQIAFPVFTMKVKADWVGVHTVAAKPTITGALCPAFNAQEGEGKAMVTVRNDGDSPATFSTSLSDCEPFRMKFAQSETQIPAHGEKTIEIPIFVPGGVSTEVSKTCKIRVESESNYDETTAECTALHTCDCKANEIFYEGGSTVWQCSADCKTRSVYLDCPEGVVFRNGAYQCSEFSPSCPDGTCDLYEQFFGTCPVDCEGPGVCGNSRIDAGETCQTCAVDVEAIKGFGFCDGEEPEPPVCGNWVDVDVFGNKVVIPDYFCAIGVFIGGVFGIILAAVMFIIIAPLLNWIIGQNLKKQQKIWGTVVSIVVALVVAGVIIIFI